MPSVILQRLPGDVRFTDGATEVVYFNQLDRRYANQPYGTDNIGGYGCGPMSMAIVVSSLTDEIVDPTAMAKWAYENGGWCKGQGSYHSLIPNAASTFEKSFVSPFAAGTLTFARKRACRTSMASARLDTVTV